MHLLVLQHVPFEGPAAIKGWAESRGHSIEHHQCATSLVYPSTDSFDLLIILGGPMGVYDELPWLSPELDFIKQCIKAEKPVFGVCLGAQLIAKALDTKVAKHSNREIGWFPVTRNERFNEQHWLFSVLPETFTPLHWHGDRFEIPENAIHLYHSEACDNQAYVYNDNIIGFQFHLEFDDATASRVGEACAEELLDKSQYVQSLEEILSDNNRFKEAHLLMHQLLDAIEQRIIEKP